MNGHTGVRNASPTARRIGYGRVSSGSGGEAGSSDVMRRHRLDRRGYGIGQLSMAVEWRSEVLSRICAVLICIGFV